MGTFIRTFIKIFAFLSAISVFLILLSLLINFFPINQNNKYFINSIGDENSPNKIAIIKLNGPILNEPSSNLDINLFSNIEIIYTTHIKKVLTELESEKIKGLIISINSPGGSVSASYNLYNLFNDFKNQNNIKVFFHTNELVASGAYWAALSGNKIYANYGSLIGSIGVKGPDWIYFDKPMSISTGLLGSSIETKNGIKKFNNIAGNSKDLFDPFRPPTNNEINDLQIAVQNIYNDFVNVVSKNRKIESEFIINEIGAMIYDTKTAKEKFLIDDISSLDIVIKKMAENLKLKNYQIIKKKGYRSNIFQKLIHTNFFSKNYMNYIHDLQNQDICNISKFGLSLMITQNELMYNC